MIFKLEGNDLFSAIEKNLFHPQVIFNHLVQFFNRQGLMAMSNKSEIRQIYASHIIANYKGIATGKKSLYIWNGIYYEFISEQLFCGIMRELFIHTNQIYDTSAGIEIYNQLIGAFALTDKEKAQINNYPTIIPFRNGYYNRITDELEPPNPRYFFTGCLNVELSNKADCPNFRKMLDKILPEKDLQLKILSYMCQCLTAEQIKLVQCWVGDGDNGKSELAKFFMLLMPEFTSLVPFSTLMEGRDMEAIADIAFAWVNLGSELHPKALTAKGIETFKQLTGEAWIRVRKLYESGYNVPPKAKHILIMNETPLPKAYCDRAFWNRIQVIPFNHPIPVEEQEDNIMDKIFEDEGGQICRMLLSLNQMLSKYLRKDPNEAERLWMWHTQSVFLFYDKLCTTGETRADELYQSYKDFCTLLNRRIESITQFTRLLSSMGVKKDRGWDSENKETYYYYTAELKDLDIKIALVNQDKELFNRIMREIENLDEEEPVKIEEYVYKEEPRQKDEKIQLIINTMLNLQKYNNVEGLTFNDIYEPLAHRLSAAVVRNALIKLEKNALVFRPAKGMWRYVS